MANEPTAAPEAPAPMPASAPATPQRKAVAFRAQKSFQGTSAMERMKAYLKDVPVLHQRLTAVVAALEQQLVDGQKHLEAAKKTLADFEATTSQIKTTVARWEEEQTHDGHDHPAAGTPAPDHRGQAGDADPTRGVAGG